MKQNFMTRGMGVILDRIIRRDVPDKAVRKAVRAEYDAVLARASDIGSSNRLLSSYALAAWFIGMDRNTGLTPEENIHILEENLRRSFLLKHFMGSAKSYFSQKHIDGCKEWSREIGRAHV